MNHSKEEVFRIEMSSHPDIVHAVENANAPPGEVNGTKRKWETMLLSISFWNKISVLACTIAVSTDPLFFYIAFFDRKKMCLYMDKRMRNAVLITRSVTDITFLFHIVYQIREAVKAAAYVSKPKLVQRGHSKLFNWFGHAKEITKKLSWSSVLTDILAVLPIPHVLILVMFYAPNYGFSENKMPLNYMLLAQYVPRIYRIFISSKLIRKNSSMWLKAAFYFFMYILSSHVIGAFWHFSSVQIEVVCWQWALGEKLKVTCDDPPLLVNSQKNITATCINGTAETFLFNYGPFSETIKTGFTGRATFRGKLIYFLWWGLKNLSNFGTDIDATVYTWNNIFAIFVSGIGLVLFSLFIGNMQQCMQSSEQNKVATDTVQMKEQEVQEWMDKNGLPEKCRDAEKLRIEIMKKITENLKDDENAEVQTLFSLLPWNTVKDLKLAICMSMLKKVGRLKNMDEGGLRVICHYLKPVTYTEKSIAFRMGEPLDSMLFIMEGIMLIYPTSTSTTTTDHQVGRANIGSPSTISGSLENGDVYGAEQLLSWASPPDMSYVSYADLPILTENVKCLSEVEGFVLTAKDLKNVLSVYKLQGNYNSSSHLVKVERSISRGTSMIRRNRINPTPWPVTDQGGNDETDIQDSNN